MWSIDATLQADLVQCAGGDLHSKHGRLSDHQPANDLRTGPSAAIAAAAAATAAATLLMLRLSPSGSTAVAVESLRAPAAAAHEASVLWPRALVTVSALVQSLWLDKVLQQ